MMEFLIENPVIEMVFGIVSFVGVVLLGWSNLMVEPPKAGLALPGILTVWESHQLRQSRKNEE
jgi:hypothetical protein